jgi:hypothetical protein
MFANPRGSALVRLDAAGQVISTAGGLSAGDQLDSDCLAAWGDLASSQLDAR